MQNRETLRGFKERMMPSKRYARKCNGQSSDWDSGIRGDMDSHAHQLKMTDFMAVDKYIFPLSVSSMNSNFKFKDYAPLAFRKLRNFFGGAEKYEYLLSVCPPDQGFINFISNSKSGQHFFFSHDMKYMIKTLSDEECKFLRRILPHYVRHMTTNPNSLYKPLLRSSQSQDASHSPKITFCCHEQYFPHTKTHPHKV